MINKLNKVQLRQSKGKKLNSPSSDLKYWECMNIRMNEILEENRVVDLKSYILYQLDTNNTLNVPKKMGICYGKKRKTL